MRSLAVSTAVLVLLLAACGTTRRVVLEQLPELSALDRELAGRGPLAFAVETGTRKGSSAAGSSTRCTVPPSFGRAPSWCSVTASSRT